MDTFLTVQGNLVADPTARATASGASVVGIRVASSGRKFDRASGEFRDSDPMYISVSCWRTLGGHVLASLRKGDSVIVHGRLLSRSYDDKQGNRRTVHEIDAVAVGPDLARCAADLRRPQRIAEPQRTGEAQSSDDGARSDAASLPSDAVGHEPAGSSVAA
jgi:single-strand DNA-binding protein